MESGAAVIDGDGVVVELADLDVDQSLGFLAGAFKLEVRAESNQLRIAAHWADLHSGDALAHNTTALPGREQPRTIGGDGTPTIGEFCVGEFAAVAGLSTATGSKLIADAVDLRHRYPMIWARICRYEVQIWICRKIANQTRHLSLEAARYVDAAVAPYLSSLPPGRLFTLVEAKLIEADPADAEARAKLAQANRFVRTGRTTDCGIKTLIARAEAGDVIMFTALCDRIAQILGLKGDPDPLDVRRSKAIGIIANPIRTIGLLAEYEGRDVTTPPEPAPDTMDETDHAWSPGTSGFRSPSWSQGSSGFRSLSLSKGRPDDLAPWPGPTEPSRRDPAGQCSTDPAPEEVFEPDPFRDQEPLDAEASGDRESPPELDPGDGPDAPPDPGAFRDRDPSAQPGSVEVPAPAGDSSAFNDHESFGQPGTFEDLALAADTTTFEDPGFLTGLGTFDGSESSADLPARPASEESAAIVDHGPAQEPTDDPVITENDLHPAEIDPYVPINYAAELQTILDRYRISPRDLLPKTVVYLHVDRDTLLKNSGVARAEDVGPITADQFKHWIRGKHLTITPVIDPANTPAVDSYQTSGRLKDALRMIMPAEAFPYGTNTGRRIDHDHAVPYRPPPDGPPGQTSTEGVLRLGRLPHRLKTHGGWKVRTPETGTTVWRSPHGWFFLTNQAGTLPLGNGDYAHTIWDTMINDFTATRHPDETDWLTG